MQRLLNLCAERPWATLVVLLLCSLLAASQLPKLQVQISAEELLVKDDPERDFYREISRQFGDEQVVLLYLEDDDLLAQPKLEALRSSIAQIEAQPFVDRVESLFSVPRVRSVQGYLDKAPYLAQLPATPEASALVLEAAAADPFIQHVLLSADRRVMAVAIVLRKDVDGGDDLDVTTTLDRLTAPLLEHYQNRFNIGYPYVRTAIAGEIEREQIRLFPLAVAALLIALFLLLRQLVDILIPIMTAGLSILWTLGLMAATGVPLNVVTSIVPILLVIVGSTEDIHLLSEFRHAQRENLGTHKALRKMARKMGRTVLLTFLTTYAGFLSVGLSGIEVLWQFGMIASTGLALNFLATTSLIPAALALAGRWQLDGSSGRLVEFDDQRARRYWRWLESNRGAVFLVLGLVALVAALGIPRIQVNHSTVDSLGKGSAVRNQVEAVNTQLAGLETFSIIVDSGIQDTFLKVRYLEELREIQDFIASQGLSRSTTSFVNYLELLNGAFQELDRPQFPASDDVVNELMIFLEHRHVRAYVSADYSTARILVRHDISSTRELQHFVDVLQGFLRKNLDPGLRARVTGSSVLTLSATEAMIDGQLQSILVLLLFFVLLMSLLFMDLRVGLLAALPNAFPVVVLFGVMGYADIPLNIGTTMAAAIAVGIAVDDTMHFLLRYNQELKNSKSQSLAVLTTIHNEALPVMATSIALIAGFLVFTLSSFSPIALFGALSALVIASALVADFMLTPLIMGTLRLVTLWDLLSLRERSHVIPKSVLFRDMRPWQIRRFVLSSSVLDFGEGRHVFRRGEPSNEMYLVMHGVVEVTVPPKRPGDPIIVVDQFGPGELFGDVAMLAAETRRTDAIALVNTSLLVLTRDAIRTTTSRHPLLAGRLFLNLATDVSRRWVGFVERLQDQRNDDEK